MPALSLYDYLRLALDLQVALYDSNVLRLSHSFQRNKSDGLFAKLIQLVR